MMGVYGVPFNLCEEDLKDEDVLCEKLVDLSSIVYTRHFYANANEKQDLISVGVLKALSLVRGGKWDPEKGKLITYLYTGIRNEMHNYIYRISREILMDNEFIDLQGSREIEEGDVSFLEIGFDIIEEVCKEFRQYGRVESRVIVDLAKRGFKVTGIDSKFEERIIREEEVGRKERELGEEFYSELINRLSGAVLWKNREFYL